MPDKQHTIRKPVSVHGIGLHTGQEVTITFKPAPVDHGYNFQRIDLKDKPVIPAIVEKVIDVSRGTTLEYNGVKVATVEHVLAALTGLEIDNVLMELDGPELPILDGSSKVYIDHLLKAGIKEQDKERKYAHLKEIVRYCEPDRGVEMIAIPSDVFRVSVMIDYNSSVLGTQHAAVNNIKEFKDEIAASRTFCFLHELEQLVESNLIRGGDLSNAIVVVDKVVDEAELNNLAKLFNQPKIEVREEGILNNIELHHENEPARHKLLDVIGDLALIGSPLKAHIIATRPGHKANVEFARLIKKVIKGKRQSAPKYDPNKEPLIDINQIIRILPHKYPMLLIDKVIEMSDDHVVAIKNVTVNEPFFQGHFPDNPVMPGVLQIEAMAQAGGVFAMRSCQDPENYETYFLKIDNVKFKRKVVPGDTLIFRLELMSPMRRGICEMRGTAYVGNHIVTEAELLARIIRKEEK